MKPAKASVRSMTGFARGTVEHPPGTSFALTFKSVNHRFLDVHVRLPSGFDALEIPLRKAVRQAIVRGHVDITLAVERANGAVETFAFNHAAIAEYIAGYRRVANELGVATEPDLNAILRLPGFSSVQEASPDDAAKMETAVIAEADRLLTQLSEMRAVEGAALARELNAGMDALEAAIARAESLRENARTAHFDHMREKITALCGTLVDSSRILQEAAMLAERGDVEEEIVRLRAHTSQFR